MQYNAACHTAETAQEGTEERDKELTWSPNSPNPNMNLIHRGSIADLTCVPSRHGSGQGPVMSGTRALAADPLNKVLHIGNMNMWEIGM